MTGLTDVQKKKLMMADNKVYELGFTDVDAIEELVDVYKRQPWSRSPTSLASHSPPFGGVSSCWN